MVRPPKRSPEDPDEDIVLRHGEDPSRSQHRIKRRIRPKSLTEKMRDSALLGLYLADRTCKNIKKVVRPSRRHWRRRVKSRWSASKRERGDCRRQIQDQGPVEAVR